jgi:hypothetical protein
MPVAGLVKPTVVGHRLVRLRGESVGESHGTTTSRAETLGVSESETHSVSTSFAETFSEGTSTTKSESVSLGESTSVARSESDGFSAGTSSATSSSFGTTTGVSHAASSGSATGVSRGETTLPVEPGMFGTPEPTVVAVSAGESSIESSGEMSGTSSAHSSAYGESSGSNSSRSRTSGTTVGGGTSKAKTTGVAHGSSSGYAVTVGASEGFAVSRGRSHAETRGTAESRATSKSEGWQEAFEPLYDNLPSAMHSKENVLYMAAQTLRNLTTGKAFINFVDHNGMHPGLLRVPEVRSFAPSSEIFEEIRLRIFATSRSAIASARAVALIREREERLVKVAQQVLLPPEPEKPADYRVARERPVPEPATAAGYRVKRERPAKREGKGKKPEGKDTP